MDVQSTIHPFRNTFYLIIYLELVPHSLSLSHLLSCLGITNSEPLQTHRQSSSLLMLPNEGDIVLLIITSVFTPQRFFAQMPIGANMLMTEAGTVFYQSVITILSFWMLPPSPTLYLGWGGQKLWGLRSRVDHHSHFYKSVVLGGGAFQAFPDFKTHTIIMCMQNTRELGLNIMKYNVSLPYCVYKGLLWSIPIENHIIRIFHFKFEVDVY